MKGGLVLIGGNCGYMAGFMGQRGVLVVCGDTGEAFADSMYDTVCFVGGNIASLGNDAIIDRPTAEDVSFLSDAVSRYLGGPPPQSAVNGRAVEEFVGSFKKVVSGRKLWNFDKTEWTTWREAL
jgi:glutamate synthase domain-containing protein 3